MHLRLLGLLWLLSLAPAPGQSVPGLVGEFTDGETTARFVAATPHFYLEPGESVHPTLGPQFRGTWRGALQVLQNAELEFSHDVTVDGRTSKKHTLTPGIHLFALAYSRTGEPAALRLQWRSAAFDWEPLPASAFSHNQADEPRDGVELGRRLVADAQCGNCHPAAGMERRVPALVGIGSRTNEKWMFAWMSRHQVATHTPQQSANLAAYLMTLRSEGAAKPRKANEVAIGKGGELFGTLGCANCHTATVEGALNGMGSKYTLDVLTAELLSRHRPSMLLNEDEATALAAYLTRSTDSGMERDAPSGDAARGAEAMTKLGCAGCHEQKRSAKPLGDLRSEVCTVVHPGWTAAEAQAARAFLQGPKDRSKAPVYEFPEKLRRFGCKACHQQGAEAPPLEGVGEKLKTAWIGEVLWGRKRVRGGRELRMPHYSEMAMRPWVASFAKAEGAAPGDGPAAPAFSEERRNTGVGMLGTNAKKKGMACIGCHDWGEYKSLGEEGPQLINATERMRFDWFERWMRNPARILSGTSMPGYFATMTRERALEPIHTLWAGMALGVKAPVPDGYRTPDLEVTSEAKPVPGKEAIVVRWDMPEATPAAIAVGLPGGQLSYCFDAGESRLLYAWRGGFLDLTGTLLRKTDQNRRTPTAALVGDVFWRSKEFSFRVGDGQRLPQRRFKGYRIVEGIPVLHYQIDGVDVYEKLTPLAAENTIQREITVSRVDGPLWFEGRPVERGVNVKLQTRLGQ